MALNLRNRAGKAYRLAKERYAALGVDTDKALKQLARIPISIHCWQGDDVGGFENAGQELGGGLAVTGNYPGKARTPDELRADFEKALSVIPGRHRFNLHACYAEMSGRKVDRDELSAEQFKNWIAWAKAIKIGLDFNPTFFAHPKVVGGVHAHAARTRPSASSGSSTASAAARSAPPSARPSATPASPTSGFPTA